MYYLFIVSELFYIMETPKKPSVQAPIVQCTLTIDNLTQQGTTKKSVTHKNVSIVLGRNEFK